MGRPELSYVPAPGSTRRRQALRLLSSFAAACLSTGCLIGPPDPLDEPEQTPPFVLTTLTSPSTFSFVETKSGQTTPFRVEFFSEDLGEPMVGKLYYNLDQEEEDDLNSAEAEPGSLDDPNSRTMTVDWTPSLPPGCYAITMIITHSSNFDDVGIPDPVEKDLAAYITWWVVHDLDPQDVSFDDCPAPRINN